MSQSVRVEPRGGAFRDGTKFTLSAKLEPPLPAAVGWRWLFTPATGGDPEESGGTSLE
ncbi:hypothetical protein [Cryptosporangium sp. NPDC051539]|uniref:hypothetical protein n=1 Tax=Cryptosporangium sp. NPDC051539 TaxID=3363962 RepID=UPI00379345C3